MPTHALAPLPRVSIDWLHREVLRAYLDDAPPELAQLAADCASGLGVGSHTDRNESRIRLAARMVATYRVQIQTVELAISEAVSRRDDKGAILLGRVAEGLAKRAKVWLEEHRLSCSPQRSISVAIGAAENVAITGER